MAYQDLNEITSYFKLLGEDSPAKHPTSYRHVSWISILTRKDKALPS